jgi:hypothetical protein
MSPRALDGHQKTGKKTSATRAPKPKPAAAPSLPARPPAPDKPKENVAAPKHQENIKAEAVAASNLPTPHPAAGSTAAVMAMGFDAKGNVVYCTPPEKFDTSRPMLRHLGGSRSDHWNQLLCNQTIDAGWFWQKMPDAEQQDQRIAILAFLAGVKPADPVEGMMAAQLYASHAASMECYRRAMLPGQPLEAKQVQLTLAAKLTKANASQVEALKKYRSKNQQKVIVEHVHVYQGGQAIVGSVTPGGVGKNNEVQPHAITHAAGAPMRCEHPQREALPVPSNAKRSLQDARGPVPGSA